MRCLGRGVDHHFVEPVVAVGQHRAPFERRARLPVHPIFAGHDDVGGACGGIDVAALDRALDIEVVAPMIMNQGRAGAQPAARVDHRVERLEIDRHRCGEVFRLGMGRGDAGGNRFADITHLVGGERRPGRRFGASRVRDDPDRLHPRQVSRGEDPLAGIGRDGDRANARMGIRAAQKDDLRPFRVGGHPRRIRRARADAARPPCAEPRRRCRSLCSMIPNSSHPPTVARSVIRSASRLRSRIALRPSHRKPRYFAKLLDLTLARSAK